MGKVLPHIAFVLVNETTPASDAPQYGGPLTPQILTQWAQDLEVQLDRDVASYWGGAYSVRAAANAADIAQGETVVAIMDALPTAGAIAYHDVSGGDVAVVFVGRQTVSSIDDLSKAISHELCETAGDYDCNIWCQDQAGYLWARELCDAVQENSYRCGLTNVSDFVLPGFFENGAQGHLTFCQASGLPGTFPGGPFETTSGGYQIRMDPAQGETQVWGQIPQHKLASSVSRLTKRVTCLPKPSSAA